MLHQFNRLYFSRLSVMSRLIFVLGLMWAFSCLSATAQDRDCDVNHDGEVNIADINSVLHAIFECVEDPAADVNGDGEVSIGDINVLIDVILYMAHQADQLDFHVGNVSFRMLKVDGGTFMMGNNNGKGNEKPVHEVTLSPYYIGQTEVTQALWKAAGCFNRSYFKGSRLPVNDVSWMECLELIKRLGVITGYRFNFPTEAQWEFAARGGNSSQGYLYAGSDDIDTVAWYHDNSNVDGVWIHEVGAKQPNELGLYDMSGNVNEWCLDRYYAYSAEPQVDPAWPAAVNDDEFCVTRGGGCFSAASPCRVTARDWCSNQVVMEIDYGLRLALQDAQPVALGVSEDNVEMIEGGVATVSVSNGLGAYHATSSDPNVATGYIEDSKLVIVAMWMGTATFSIWDDQSDLRAQVLVRVGKECSVGEVSFKMMPVEGGTFMMGNTSEQGVSGVNGHDRPEPVHQVTLSSYGIGQTEVTQQLWTAVMGYNPCDVGFINPQGPVGSMSWDECMEFISRLNQLTGLNFRLPTEAEWEFAARGGNRSKHYRYSGSHYLKEVAWYRDNADNYQGGGLHGPQTVALLLPNELGLYDMSGNVSELCQDWYGPYSAEPQTNPTGPASGDKRVTRGGSFAHGRDECCCASRDHTYTWPFEGGNLLGFRLAM